MLGLTDKQLKAREMICLPLDGMNDFEEIKELITELAPYIGMLKIGKETFTRFGPQIVLLVQSFGLKVFLDLKYHDIPNTVEGASKAAAELGVYMINVHASGGIKMMKAAVDGVKHAKTKIKPKIVAVTILTSIDQKIMNKELNIPGDVEKQVLNLALNAKKAHLDGIVCSGKDLDSIKDKFPKDFLFVTPGIKGPNTKAGSDQKRVLTPGAAVKAGAIILVIGRAITEAKDRKKAALEVIDDIVKVL